MTNKFVCGADITFLGHKKFAIDYMGMFDTVEEAVLENREIHPAFGYNIYEVKPNLTDGLTRSFGIRQGTGCSGYEVVRLVCQAYEHPAWVVRP